MHQLTTEQTTAIDKINAIHGTPLSLLFYMLIFDRPMGVTDLAALTPYSRPPITQALRTLASRGLVQNHSRYNGWLPTAKAEQLYLSVNPILVEGRENYFPSRYSSSSLIIKDIKDINLTTTTTESKEKNLPSFVASDEVREALSNAGAWASSINSLAGALNNDFELTKAYCVPGISPQLLAHRIRNGIPPETPLPGKPQTAQDILDKYTNHELSDFFER